MNEMLAFLRTIAENQGDDVPRLVFADWLEENGHPGRAEFIRLQIDLARMDPSDEGYVEKTAKMRRCGVFTDAGQFPFFDHLPTEKCRIGFSRGFIGTIDTSASDSINQPDFDATETSGFDLIPLHTLRTGQKLIDHFKVFTNLERLQLSTREGDTPAQLLEILGPEGPFKKIEELSLPELSADCLEAGVIPRFDLPHLRNFYLSTEAFYNLGVRGSGEGDDDYDTYGRRAWGGLPDYFPRNALPNEGSPLERFVWHSQDDSDLFNDEDWYWRGPSMESLLEYLKDRDLKQIEVAVYYDEHEGGLEGVIASPHRQDPLALSLALERVTLDENDTRMLWDSARSLRALRVYGVGYADEEVLTFLNRGVCSDLESLHIQTRGEGAGTYPTVSPKVDFSKLKSFCLSGQPLGLFSNCRFPDLISLMGDFPVKTLLEREWPSLQHLNLTLRSGSEAILGLRAFAESDRFPNLTTLSLRDYFYPTNEELSFLAECPQMPFLSLIRFPDAWPERAYIVDGGELIPVRSDIMTDGNKLTTPYHFPTDF